MKPEQKIEKFGAGGTKYPIKAGAVIRLEKSFHKYNPKADCFGPHHCYIWIVWVAKIPAYKKPKQRKVKIRRIWIPDSNNYRPFYLPRKKNGMADRDKIEKKVSHSYIADLCFKHGYNQVGYISVREKKPGYKQFYQIAGIL